MTAHPAKYSPAILDALRTLLSESPGPILDPFAGTGLIHTLGRQDTIGMEIEAEWASMHERTMHGDSARLPLPSEWIGTVCTSPAYGNRMADQYDGRDGSKRHTYRIALGRPLTAGSGAGLQWGPEYRCLHQQVWREVVRVLRPGGVMILNVSDHIRKSEVVPVTSWHVEELTSLGLVETIRQDITTPRVRHGRNHQARVDVEHIISFGKPPCR